MPGTATMEAAAQVVPERSAQGHSDAGIAAPPLAALRRTTRPDRARVAAYLSFAHHQTKYPEYHEFSSAHRCWLAALDHALTEAERDYDLPPRSSRDRPAEPQPGLALPEVRIPPIRSHAQALGYLYVSEAFRLGGRVLSRELGSFGVSHEDDGEAPPARAGMDPWHRVARAIGGALPEECKAIIESASTLFSDWERWIAPCRARLEMT